MPRSLRLIFAFALAFAAAPLPADETPAREAYGAGVDAFQLRHWSAAESHFRSAVKLKSDYAEAYDKLGESLFNEGKVMEAVTDFKLAVAIDPRLTQAWYDEGFGFENLDSDVALKDDDKTRAKLKKTEADDAIAAYRKALEVNPVNDGAALANVHYRLGVLLRDQAMKVWNENHPEDMSPTAEAPSLEGANLKEAMLHLEAANALNTDFPENRNELGRLYDIIGRYPEAIEQYDKAIRGQRNFAEAYSNRGVAWWKLGNWDRALEDERKATEIDPRFAGGHYNFGEVVFAHVQELRLAGTDSQRSTIHVEAQKAVDEYRVATQLDPGLMAAWYGLAKAYRGYFDFDNAEKTYNKILDMDKRQHKAKELLKALVLERKGFENHIPKQYRDDQAKGS